MRDVSPTSSERDSSSRDEHGTAESIATAVTARARRSRDWLLIRGNRTVVGITITASFAVFFGGLTMLGLLPFSNLQSVYYVYGGVISGNLTLITVAVSVNQLLLSRELGTPGELQSQISNVIDYRRDVEDVAGRVAPVEPLEFLRLLVEATRQEAQALGGLIRGESVTARDDEIEDVVTTVTREMDRTDGLLDEGTSSTIDVLSTMLMTNFALQINSLRRAKHDADSDVPDAVEDAIDGLIERLQYIDIARQYFKTVYFKQELSSFSRALLSAGIPAEGAAITALLLLSASASKPFAVAHLRVLIPVTISSALLPLGVLASFILRTATVNRRTAATVPFTAPEQEK